MPLTHVNFRWNDWNLDHIAKHGVTTAETEYVIRRARSPYPRRSGPGKFMVHGQTPDGYYLQVGFVWDSPDEQAYVIHARPLTRAEVRRLRRKRK